LLLVFEAYEAPFGGDESKKLWERLQGPLDQVADTMAQTLWDFFRDGWHIEKELPKFGFGEPVTEDVAEWLAGLVGRTWPEFQQHAEAELPEPPEWTAKAKKKSSRKKTNTKQGGKKKAGARRRGKMAAANDDTGE
jgi:hypothetical protein